METLRSYVHGTWYEAKGGFAPLYDPCSENAIAQASSDGFDAAAALTHARDTGGPALRALSFKARGELLMALSKVLSDAREDLINVSLLNTGVTRKDAKFDLDGAAGVLAYYAYLAKDLGDRRVLPDGEGAQLGRSARFWSQHAWVPLRGAAVLINAFNFPAWGFAEKMACAFLAGVPVIVKPATSSALITERCARLLVDSGHLPSGSFSFIAGSLGDLLDRLGSQDVVAFTGSAATGLKIRQRPNFLAASTRVNVEADSLNAAVLGPDVEPGSDTWNLFLKEVAREMTQKTGQKCTAVRRVFVPEAQLDLVRDELAFRLGETITGNPVEPSVTMGPLATNSQLAEAIAGVALLRESGAQLVHGTGARCNGVGNPAGKGYFFGPALLVADPDRAGRVHDHEVFGPVATLMSYDGTANRAGVMVSRGGGSLVASIYSDDENWIADLVPHAGAWSGRLYLGSKKMAEQALGSGLAMPQSKHGGPGRAGGGEEMGAGRGLQLYLQRVALQGSRAMLDRLCSEAVVDADQG